MFKSSNCALANSTAEAQCSSLVSARAIAWTFEDIAKSSRDGRDKPCRNELRLDTILPSAVFGPVERLALARLAAICLSVAMAACKLGASGAILHNPRPAVLSICIRFLGRFLTLPLAFFELFDFALI